LVVEWIVVYKQVVAKGVLLECNSSLPSRMLVPMRTSLELFWNLEGDSVLKWVGAVIGPKG
jgi:hypothetical protein